MNNCVFAKCSVIFLILLVCQPAFQKSFERHWNRKYSQEQTRLSREAASDSIMFPAEALSKRDPSLRGGSFENLSPTPCPDKLPYCESADDYPKDKIQEILKKQPKLLLDHFHFEDDDADIDRFRPDYDPNESPLCSSVKRTVYPTKAQSKDGLFFVVNHDQYRQGVKVETCQNNGGECQIPGTLSLGYSSRCVQRHIVRTLVVLNNNSSNVEGFVSKPFEFPSCCSCVVTITSGLDRLGVSSTTFTNTTNTVTPPVARTKPLKAKLL